jgi:hypothetical protein
MSAWSRRRACEREARDARDVLEREWIGEVADDVIDGAVDPVDVVVVRKIWQAGHRAVA